MEGKKEIGKIAVQSLDDSLPIRQKRLSQTGYQDRNGYLIEATIFNYRTRDECDLGMKNDPVSTRKEGLCKSEVVLM